MFGIGLGVCIVGVPVGVRAAPSVALGLVQIGSNNTQIVLLKRGAEGALLETQEVAPGDTRLRVGFEGGRYAAWVRLRSGVPETFSSIELIDASGRPTSRLASARRVRTLRDGVSARDSIDGIVWGGPGEDAYGRESESSRRLGARKANGAKRAQPITPGRDWAVDCEGFIDSAGNYGPWGRHLLETVGASSHPLLVWYSPGDILTMCPRYGDFSLADRQAFYVWFAAAVAMRESGCDPRASAQGPNGRAVGLWQLHEGKTASYADGVCGSFDVRDPFKNVKCGFDMLEWYVGRPNNPQRLVYWRGNYWEVLHPGRPSQRETHRLIRGYAACG